MQDNYNIPKSGNSFMPQFLREIRNKLLFMSLFLWNQLGLYYHEP